MTGETKRGFTLYLMFTTMLCGGLVMLLELLGSRVIGPFFGVGLFVWTSLIAVALVALALGYSVGGWLSDRYRDPAYLYAVISLAGVLVLCIPVIQAPVLKASQQLGLRGGTLFSSLVLFGPSLFLLGFVSPYVVKIAVAELRAIGKTVGRFYALSTIGSGVGTLLTGFFLIPWLGVKGIFVFAGALLLALGAGYFLLFARRWVALALLPLPFLISGTDPVLEKTMSDGTRVTLVEGEESYYGRLKVLDYSYGSQRIRELTIDSLVQGGVDMSSGLSIYGYPYVLQLLPRALHPAGERALMIGVGAGIVPRWYSEQGVLTDVVDIDPAVVTMAAEHFDFATSGDVHIEDARYYLRRTRDRYDYLLLDVFSGDSTPGHVLSREAMALVATRLTPAGVFAANLVGDLGNDTFVTASIVKTVAAHFDQVELYPTFRVSTDNPSGNYVLVAYNGAPRHFEPRRVLAGEPLHPFVQREVAMALTRPYQLPRGAAGLVLTDNYNPIEFYDVAVREQIRRDILRDSDPDMLL
ncbi:fused MFS/spermidine synthase [Motiliproteus sediminis]|uniref:fused MFS/spermidine synthase n=1 Tax=Motiliproteus sediminis TaxID=1468178 RepID=UPI001AEFE080|nr:fused MFS/spermidine synthase [Motiliproteus sediminis]